MSTLRCCHMTDFVGRKQPSSTSWWLDRARRSIAAILKPRWIPTLLLGVELQRLILFTFWAMISYSIFREAISYEIKVIPWSKVPNRRIWYLSPSGLKNSCAKLVAWITYLKIGILGVRPEVSRKPLIHIWMLVLWTSFHEKRCMFFLHKSEP